MKHHTAQKHLEGPEFETLTLYVPTDGGQNTCLFGELWEISNRVVSEIKRESQKI